MSEIWNRLANIDTGVIHRTIYVPSCGSLSKQPKLSEKNHDTVDAIDRISRLPDAVICHILSFIPTKEAVSTSILSSRWKYLFKHVVSLDFDDSSSQNFRRFVRKVLAVNNESRIQKFKLNCSDPDNCEMAHINRWICAALRREVQELDLRITEEDELSTLPDELFASESLVALEISVHFPLGVPIKVMLPKLTRMTLFYVCFKDDESIQMLISGCPVLEELNLLECLFFEIQRLSIVTPSLKRLNIDCSADYFHYTTGQACRYQILIDAPNLLYLKYADFVPYGFLVKSSLSLLREAEMDVALRMEKEDDQDEEVVDYDECLPSFSNTKCLTLVLNRYCGWTMLPDLLKRTPIVETLVFEKRLMYEGNYRERNNYCSDWDPFPDPPSPCLTFHLKTIEIGQFTGNDIEMKMVKYFLEKAKILREMKIHLTTTNEEDQLGICWKLLKFPRSSTACKIELRLCWVDPDRRKPLYWDTRVYPYKCFWGSVTEYSYWKIRACSRKCSCYRPKRKCSWMTY